MATYPLFCASHTVRGTCTLGTIDGTGANSTVTIPEGVYWTDVATQGHAASNLWSKVNALIDADDGGAYGMSVTCSAQSLGRYSMSWDASISSSGKFRPAGANAEGLRVYQRLGVSRTTNSPVTFFQTVEGGPPYGVWTPGNRAEVMPSWTHTQGNSGTSGEAWGGKAWTFSVGEPSKRRLIQLNQVDRGRVKIEDGSINIGDVDTDNDYSFETLLWPYLARGEMVRVYSDRDVTATYLTSDVTATATTLPIALGTGIANGDTIWLDGERIYVVSGGGTSTLTVERPDPWAHDAGAPLSLAHVATYVLDEDGGDVNIRGFTSQRRGSNQTRYDMSIALVQTKFTED